MFKCNKDENLKVSSEKQDTEFRVGPKFIIFKGCWEEWGRKNHDCKRWGLCNFKICWFPQITGDYCCDGIAPNNQGLLVYDTIALTTSLVIELDNTDSIEVASASNSTPLYIDEDIIVKAYYSTWDSLKMSSGVYSYDSNIGSHGGYDVPLTIIY